MITRLLASLVVSFLIMTSAAGQPGPAAPPSYPGATVHPQRSPALPVDCRALRMVAPGQRGCEVWEVKFQAYSRPTQWFEDSLPAPDCLMEWQSAKTSSGRLDGIVQLVRLKASSDMRCSLGGRGVIAPIWRTRLIDAAVQNAKDLTFPDWSGDTLLSAFTSTEGRPCRAFVALGPNQTSSRGGDNRAYHLHGFVCAVSGGPISDAELGGFITAVQIRLG